MRGKEKRQRPALEKTEEETNQAVKEQNRPQVLNYMIEEY